MRWARHVASIGEIRNSYKILVVAPERKRLWGPPSLLSNMYQVIFPWS
jgi:hypothetical protein